VTLGPTHLPPDARLPPPPAPLARMPVYVRDGEFASSFGLMGEGR
jgi:hypothetical protein